MKKNYMILMIGILGSLLLSTTGYSQSNSTASGVGKEELNTKQSEETNTNQNKDNTEGKKNKKTITIEFDKEGKIISDLPEEIKWNKNLKFHCKDSNDLNSNLKAEMIRNLEQSYKNLISKESKEKLLLQYPLFINDSNMSEWLDSTTYLEEIYKIRDEVKNEIHFLHVADTVSDSDYIPEVRTDSTTYFTVENDIKNSKAKKNKIDFELRIISMDSILVKWLKYSRPEILTRLKLMKLDSTFNETEKDFKIIEEATSACDSIQNAITKLERVDNYVNEVLKVNLKPWLLNWIWKNGDVFKLNPIEIVRKKEPDSIQIQMIAGIPTMEARINALNKILESKSEIGGNLAIAIAETIGKLTGELAKAKSIKEEFDKLKNAPDKVYFNNNLLYKGFFYATTADRTFYMRHHDASNDYEILGKLRKYYLEDYKVKYLVQNQTADKETKLFESVSVADDYSDLTSGMLEAFASINMTEVDLLREYNKSNLSQQPFIEDTVQLCGADSLNLRKRIVDNKIIKFNAARVKLNWLLKQGELDPIPQLVADETPKYRTDEAGPTKNVEAPARVSYVLRERPYGSHPDTVGTTVIDSISYKVYALHRFQPFVGFAFGTVKRNILNIDDNGNLISVEKEYKENTFLGVKIYPKKTDIHNSKFFLCKKSDILSRFNILAGMDFTNINPVDNFMVGSGIDIFPGLNVSIYGNWYKNNTYKIEQGKFKKDGRPLMFDHGFMISLDPVVIFNFAKLIAKP
ncbi:MAG: hypothetical protein IPN54_05925 [Bacteroidetes bacterium]|nr:hypothetical protein [Bacteroidota bacterium]